MREGKGASIMDYFETLEDPRIDRCKRHKLLDIIAIAICAVICGADSWVYIELFGKSKLEWFQTFLELPHGIPSHDTFGDVFSRLDPDPAWGNASQFQQCFMAWTQAVSDLVPGEVVAIDGKTVRRSHDRNSGKRAIHLVSAWASANTQVTLGQVKTEEKSNEITAIPQLLQMLELKGCIVTIDAMGCQPRTRTSPRGFWTGAPTTYFSLALNTRVNCTKTCGTCSRERRSSASRVFPTTTPPP